MHLRTQTHVCKSRKLLSQFNLCTNSASTDATCPFETSWLLTLDRGSWAPPCPARRLSLLQRTRSSLDTLLKINLHLHNDHPMKAQQQQHLPLTVLSALLWATTNVYAFQMSSLFNGVIVDQVMSSSSSSRHLEATEDTGDNPSGFGGHAHIIDALIITVFAWLVFVVVSLFDYIIASLHNIKSVV